MLEKISIASLKTDSKLDLKRDYRPAGCGEADLVDAAKEANLMEAIIAGKKLSQEEERRKKWEQFFACGMPTISPMYLALHLIFL